MLLSCLLLINHIFADCSCSLVHSTLKEITNLIEGQKKLLEFSKKTELSKSMGLKLISGAKTLTSEIMQAENEFVAIEDHECEYIFPAFQFDPDLIHYFIAEPEEIEIGIMETNRAIKRFEELVYNFNALPNISKYVNETQFSPDAQLSLCVKKYN